MNIIERSLVDTDQDIIDFCDSVEFPKFVKIMERLYLEKLVTFHSESIDKLEVSRANLNTLLNLPALLESTKQMILHNRKTNREKTT